jgi:hypothetical protein
VTPSRGKKGKSKKIKEKYADQDDEERELRMELLGVCSKFLIASAMNRLTDEWLHCV